MEKRPKTFAEFLQDVPPYTEVEIGLIRDILHPFAVNFPIIELFCEKCDGLRFFQPQTQDWLPPDCWKHFFFVYACKNCSKTKKQFSAFFNCPNLSRAGKALKIGELPAFGPTTPTRMLRFLAEDREIFLQGRRAESQGMGIGAFAYYRRVVENQKNRLIDEIINVSIRLNAGKEFIDSLKAARNEVQFSSAIEKIKDGLPETLKMNGHNPLTLLHQPLSVGIHSVSDSECLELARSIRLVLTELAERIDQALQDHAELNEAVTKLLQATTKPNAANTRPKGGPPTPVN